MSVFDSGWISITALDTPVFYNTTKAWDINLVEDQYLVTNQPFYSGNPGFAVEPWIEWLNAGKGGMMAGPVISNCPPFNKANTNVFFYKPSGSSPSANYTHGRIVREW